MIISTGVLVFWVTCAVLDYGLSFAYYQREFPTLAQRDYTHDRACAALGAVAGPVSLLVSLCMGLHKHGFKYR